MNANNNTLLYKEKGSNHTREETYSYRSTSFQIRPVVGVALKGSYSISSTLSFFLQAQANYLNTELEYFKVLDNSAQDITSQKTKYDLHLSQATFSLGVSIRTQGIYEKMIVPTMGHLFPVDSRY